jgi:hypothetical protein
MLPRGAGARTQRALHDAAAPRDHPAAQHHARGGGDDERERQLGEREN